MLCAVAVPAAAAALVLSVTVTPVYFGVRFVMFVFPSVALALRSTVGSLATRALRWAVVVAVAAVLALGVRAEATTVSRTGLAAFAELWRHSGPPDAVFFFPRWNRRVAGSSLGAPVMNVPTREDLEAELRRRGAIRVWEVVPMGHTPDRPSGEWAYHEWLRGLGEARPVGIVEDVEVTEIVAHRLEPDYAELPSGGFIDVGRSDTARFFCVGWYGLEGSFRWSRGTRAEIVFTVSPGASHRLVLDASRLGDQRVSVTLNGCAVGDYHCADWSLHRRSFDLSPGALRPTNRLLFSLPDARSPASLGKGRDRRILALAVHRACLESAGESRAAGHLDPGAAP